MQNKYREIDTKLLIILPLSRSSPSLKSRMRSSRASCMEVKRTLIPSNVTMPPCVVRLWVWRKKSRKMRKDSLRPLFWRLSSRLLMSSNSHRSIRLHMITTQDMIIDTTKMLRKSSTTYGESIVRSTISSWGRSTSSSLQIGNIKKRRVSWTLGRHLP